MNFSSQELAHKYNQFAHWYDWVEGVPDLLGVSRFRRRLLQRASGKVLEVAVGTGKNLHYPPGCRIVAVDVSKEMLNVARKRAVKLSIDVCFCWRTLRFLLFPTGASIPSFLLWPCARSQIRSLYFRRWREFAPQREKSFC
jgi:ubiquinone/menaquinone biosynthesis C-methylase UbiE